MTAATPPRTRRERQREATLHDIRTAALQQIRAEGAAALSLRNVARTVGLSSAGIYRYFASRDELLTDLVATAFTALAESIEQADPGPAASGDSRMRAAAATLRRWSFEHPVDFGLLFGAPVPGYHAPPAGPTVPAAARFSRAMAGPVAQAWREALAATGQEPPRPSGPDGPDTDDPRFTPVFARSWTRLHGVLALHLYGQLAALGLDDEAARRLYDAETDAVIEALLAR
jgi:AcrR family transcriptional regulator